MLGLSLDGPLERNFETMAILGCLLTGIIAIALVAGIDALIALVITWALNTYTQLHPTYMTVFVVLVVISLFFGGVNAKSRKK